MELDRGEVERWLREHWLNRIEASRLLDASVEWVHRLASTGRLETLETPVGRLYSREGVECLAAERARRGRRGRRGTHAQLDLDEDG
jgi:hypothetical protein